MSNINIDNIIEKTNQKIGYDNFKKENIMRKNKIKNVAFTFLCIGIITLTTISVDALTDNSISNAIENFINVRVNNKDYNATCSEKEDGSLSCKVGDTGVEYVVSKEGKDYKYDIDVTTDNEGGTENILITGIENK